MCLLRAKHRPCTSIVRFMQKQLLTPKRVQRRAPHVKPRLFVVSRSGTGVEVLDEAAFEAYRMRKVTSVPFGISSASTCGAGILLSCSSFCLMAFPQHMHSGEHLTMRPACRLTSQCCQGQQANTNLEWVQPET